MWCLRSHRLNMWFQWSNKHRVFEMDIHPISLMGKMISRISCKTYSSEFFVIQVNWVEYDYYCNTDLPFNLTTIGTFSVCCILSTRTASGPYHNLVNWAALLNWKLYRAEHYLQSCWLQFSVSSTSWSAVKSWHPAWHVRVLVLTPPPHVFEQDDQSLQIVNCRPYYKQVFNTVFELN